MAAITKEIKGSKFSEILIGTDDNEIISGLAGNDMLNGGGGDDRIFGNRGNDTLIGGAGNDEMTGGLDADLFIVDAGTDEITDLGKGGDQIWIYNGATANATVFTNWTATGDTKNNGTANIFANGNCVDVSASTGASGFTISNEGNKHGSYLTGSIQNDTLLGGLARDFLRGGAGDDYLNGGAGNNILTGGSGSDTFAVTKGSDWINDLGNGKDVLKVDAAGRVDAVLAADWTANSYSKNEGIAFLRANGHNVDVSATGGTRGWNIGNGDVSDDSAVTITGSRQNDTLSGGNGGDIITGNAGDDILAGFAGADIFVFAAHGWGHDTVTDFTIGEDKLDLRGLGLSDFSDLDVAESDDGTVITMDDDSVITLQNVNGLTNSDFLFA